jgi:hypothetical protein
MKCVLGNKLGIEADDGGGFDSLTEGFEVALAGDDRRRHWGEAIVVTNKVVKRRGAEKKHCKPSSRGLTGRRSAPLGLASGDVARRLTGELLARG